jgi:hypothetical protein
MQMNYESYEMPSKSKFKSDAFEAIYTAAEGLHRAGTIDKATMRSFDASCLKVPEEIAPNNDGVASAETAWSAS